MSYKIACQVCYKHIGSKNSKSGKAEAALIKHYQEKHPDDPQYCYSQVQKTWNPVYDVILKTMKEYADKLTIATRKNEEWEKLYRQEAAIRNTLATKLNGIIMILESKQEVKP